VAMYFCESVVMYGTAELMVAAVFMPPTGMTASIPTLTTLGEDMQTLDIVSGQFQMLQRTSQPRSYQMRQGSEIPHSH
jgi:hypothetical protein